MDFLELGNFYDLLNKDVNTNQAQRSQKIVPSIECIKEGRYIVIKGVFNLCNHVNLDQNKAAGYFSKKLGCNVFCEGSLMKIPLQKKNNDLFKRVLIIVKEFKKTFAYCSVCLSPQVNWSNESMLKTCLACGNNSKS